MDVSEQKSNFTEGHCKILLITVLTNVHCVLYYLMGIILSRLLISMDVIFDLV